MQHARWGATAVEFQNEVARMMGFFLFVWFWQQAGEKPDQVSSLLSEPLGSRIVRKSLIGVD